MANYEKYKTKPIDCWQKGKELGAAYQQYPSTIKEQGKVLGMGLANVSNSIPAAFEDCEFIDYGIYAPTLATGKDIATQYMEAVGARGFSSNVCHFTQLIWGAIFLDRFPFGDFWPDFWLQFHCCESQGKGAQIGGEHSGIPFFCIDIPIIERHKSKEFHLDYLISQLNDAIEWIEKVTGKKCIDQKLIESVQNEFRAASLSAKILLLNKTIPAPLSSLTLNALCGPLVLYWKHKKETVEFLQILYDEVQDRVQNHIAALATERCRLFHEGLPPFSFMRRLFRYVETYGALFVGSDSEFSSSGGFRREDGKPWQAIENLEERGIKLNNREEALQAIAQYLLDHAIVSNCHVSENVEDVVQRADDWSVDGVIFHRDCGCQLYPTSMLEAKLALREKDIPSMVYEGSMVNPNDVVESDIINLLDTFLQALGLSQLED
ncbi:2-hydroxyacyl-CoA dehydratase subunit D [Chloroflexota bacterium]